MDRLIEWLPCILLLLIAGYILYKIMAPEKPKEFKVKPWLLDEQSLAGFDKEQKQLLREVARECEKEIAFMSDIASHYPAYATLHPIGNGPASLMPFMQLKKVCTPEMLPILEHFLRHISESVTYRVIWDAEHDYEENYESPVPSWLSDIIAACREKEEKGCPNPTT